MTRRKSEAPAFRGRRRPRVFVPVPRVPFYWRRVTSGAGIRTAAQKRDWQLVLSARGIPFVVCGVNRREHIYVPCLLSGLAEHELTAYACENARERQSAPPARVYGDWPVAAALVLPLIWWHGCQIGWWEVPGFLPAPGQWQADGSLNGAQVVFYGQWWRLATALTLHSGLAHLSGNVVFGAIFLALLARLCGSGRAWLMAVSGGAFGNALSVLVHAPGYASLGFSTALFAAIGAIGGIRACQSARKLFMPLGAAVALLAMLGTEGAQTDYGAHICGLGAGCLLGILYAASRRLRWPDLPQWLAGMCAFGLLAAAWILAFGHAG